MDKESLNIVYTIWDYENSVEMPELIEKPVLIADSHRRKDALICIVPGVDADKLPLIYAIKPNGMGVANEIGQIETNMILSFYGKDYFHEYFEKNIPPEKVVYINKGRWQDLERLAGIQCPGSYSCLATNIILRRPQCIVNENEYSLRSQVKEVKAASTALTQADDMGQEKKIERRAGGEER